MTYPSYPEKARGCGVFFFERVKRVWSRNKKGNKGKRDKKNKKGKGYGVWNMG